MKPFRVLLVEDITAARDAVAIFLSERGYEVLDANNGYEALRVLEQSEVDVVITDLDMPIIDGESLLRILREKYPKLSVIFLTGCLKDRQADVTQADAVLLKPCDLTLILRTLKSMQKKVEASESKLDA